MGNYIIIGVDGYGMYVSVSDIILISPDSRSPLDTVDIYYTSGNKVTFGLSSRVDVTDKYKLLNYFIDKIANDERVGPIGMNGQVKPTIGGSRDASTGQYSSEIPFLDPSSNPITITSVTVS
tara:strand:- start:306 stop:671 length:366 start_codon:yes stop_codon:yes gene_type:complete